MTEEKTKLLPNHIEEYIDRNVSKENNFIELFQAENSDVDLKSDLSPMEIVYLNKLFNNGKFIESKGLKNPYKQFIIEFLRLKFSQGRMSRNEFVDVNRRDRFKQNIKEFSNFKNLLDTKT